MAALLLLLTTVAEAQRRVTVTMRNGGSITGTVVVDMPGEPLIIEAGGRTFTVERDDITALVPVDSDTASPQPSVDPETATTQPAGTAGSGTAPPASSPVPTVATAGESEATSAAPAGQLQPLVGPLNTPYLTVDPRLPPAVQELVVEWNDLQADARRGKKYGLPIAMWALGVVGYIATASISAAWVGNYDSCVVDDPWDDCEETWLDGLPIVRGAGYGLSTALIGLGTLFFFLRWAGLRRARNRLPGVRDEMEEHGYEPIFDATVTVSGGGRLTLRASF